MMNAGVFCIELTLVISKDVPEGSSYVDAFGYTSGSPISRPILLAAITEGPSGGLKGHQGDQL
jgi:hypothetical protein